MHRGKARRLRANPEPRAIIEVHGNNCGTDAYNFTWGKDAPDAPAVSFETPGGDSLRLRMVSYGQKRLLEAGTCEEIRARNRRAHLGIAPRLCLFIRFMS